MAKGQKRGNRELKKPKKVKAPSQPLAMQAKVQTASAGFLKKKP